MGQSALRRCDPEPSPSSAVTRLACRALIMCTGNEDHCPVSTVALGPQKRRVREIAIGDHRAGDTSQRVSCHVAGTRHRHEICIVGGHNAEEDTDPCRRLQRDNARMFEPVSRQREREPLPRVGDRRFRGDIRKKSVSNSSIPSTKLPGQDSKASRCQGPDSHRRHYYSKRRALRPQCARRPRPDPPITIFQTRGRHLRIPSRDRQVSARPRQGLMSRIRQMPRGWPSDRERL